MPRKRRKVSPSRLRQQRVEDRRGHRDVDGGEQRLHQRHARARQVDLVAEERHGRMKRRQHDIGDDDRPSSGSRHGLQRPVRHGGAEEGHHLRLKNSTSPPSAMPPRPKVRLVKPTTLAISSGVSPQAE